MKAKDSINNYFSIGNIQNVNSVFGNSINKKAYLDRLGIKYKKSLPGSQLNEIIFNTWDDEKSVKIINELFKQSSKYDNFKKSGDDYDFYISKISEKYPDWWEKNNTLSMTELDSLYQMKVRKRVDPYSSEIIELNARAYWTKALAATRNDFLEYLFYESNPEIIPTFGNKNGVDCIYKGEAYDIKNSKSVGSAFQNKHKASWKEVALQHPEEVALSLYENQDKSRFSDTNRIYIINLENEKLTSKDIVSKISQLKISELNPYIIKFNEKNLKCYVIYY